MSGYLVHGAEWKTHKYIRKEGDRYIYEEPSAKPISRKTNVTGQGKGIYRRGEGLNSKAPVSGGPTTNLGVVSSSQTALENAKKELDDWVSSKDFANAFDSKVRTFANKIVKEDYTIKDLLRDLDTVTYKDSSKPGTTSLVYFGVVAELLDTMPPSVRNVFSTLLNRAKKVANQEVSKRKKPSNAMTHSGLYSVKMVEQYE